MTPGPIHTYTVTLRYSLEKHDTPKEITLSEIQANSPQEAGWLAKVQLRQAHMGPTLRKPRLAPYDPKTTGPFG